MIGNAGALAKLFTSSYNPQDNSYHIVGTENGQNVIDATWSASTNALQINTLNLDGTHSFLQSTNVGASITTYLPTGQLVELTTMGNQGGVTTTWDVLNSFLWDRQVTEFTAPGSVISDTRDYTSVANQWLASHTLPSGNFSKTDEDFAVNWSAQVERFAQVFTDDLQSGADNGVIAGSPGGLLAGFQGGKVESRGRGGLDGGFGDGQRGGGHGLDPSVTDCG
jgi:hypothetical protein